MAGKLSRTAYPAVRASSLEAGALACDTVMALCTWGFVQRVCLSRFLRALIGIEIQADLSYGQICTGRLNDACCYVVLTGLCSWLCPIRSV